MSENNQNQTNSQNNGNQNNSGGGGKYKSRRNNNHNIKNKNQQSKLVGQEPLLGSHVFVLNDPKQIDKNTKTMERIYEFIITTFKERGRDVVKSLRSGKKVEYTLPTEGHGTTPAIKKLVLETKIKQAIHDGNQLDKELYQAYGLMKGQCNKQVLNKLKSRQDWTQMDIDTDAIKLHKAIKEIGQDYQDNENPVVSIHKILEKAFNMKQNDGESLTDYYERFANNKDVVDTLYGSFSMEKLVDREIQENPVTVAAVLRAEGMDDEAYEAAQAQARTTAERPVREERRKAASNRLTALMYLSGAKKGPALLQELANMYAMNDSKYPETLEAAHELLVKFKANNPGKPNDNRNNRNGGNQDNQFQKTSFAQKQNRDKGRGCFRCGKKDHIARYCTEVNGSSNVQTEQPGNNNQQQDNSTNGNNSGTTQRVQFMQLAGMNFVEAKEKLEGKLLLDNCSTTDIFKDGKYLENIHDSNDTLYLHTNGGVAKTNQKGTLPGYGEVWYDPKGIANILSLSNVKKSGRYNIEYIYQDGKFIVTNTENGNVITFCEDADGLHVAPMEFKVEEVAHLNTVEENKTFYTKRQVEGAEKAQKLLETTGASIRDLKVIVSTNLIKNNPVTLEDVKVCEKIFGPSVPALKGKSVRQQPKPVVDDYIEIPRQLIKAHEGVTLFADVLYVEGVTFLITMSKHIKLITVRWIQDRSKETLMQALDETMTTYNKAGFFIKQFRADPEFECMREELEANDIQVHIYAAQEHVPDIERMNRTVKDRVRTMWHSLPYSMWPRIMIVHGVSERVRWLNTFPPKGGISQTFSPRTIITGRPIDYDKHCKYRFGGYVQAFTRNEPTNTMEERCLDCIYLKPLDTIQGGHVLLNLKTGQIVTRHHVQELPIPPRVIARVEQLAKNDGFSPHADPIIRTYASLAGVDDDDSSQDSDYQLDSEEESDEDSYTSEEESLVDEDTVTSEVEEFFTPGVGASDNQSIQSDTDPDNIPVPALNRKSGRARKPTQLLQPTMTGQSYAKAAAYLAMKEKKSEHLFTQTNTVNKLEYESQEAIVLGVAFAQTFSLKQGIKRFGDKGTQAAHDEMKQLHDRDCFKPIHISSLNNQQRRRAMETLIFLTEKRDGRIKARTCANGSIQREWITKEESSSPTVTLEALMLSAAIDAMEGREVAVVDIPNAFIQTEYEKVGKDEDMAVVKFRGKLAEILVEIDPSYAEYLTYVKGVPVLYAELSKALYGTVVASLLFYRKIRKDLEEDGYKVNPYDPCVANKIINGKQSSVLWHVDDLKMSHMDTPVVDKFVEWARKKYEDATITKLKPSRGKIHDYLGMTLDYTRPGAVKIYMKDYIRKMLEEYQYKSELASMKKVSTPAAEHLFDTNPKTKALDNKKKEDFHTMVAKALFLCKRARPDLQPTVPFLCTRVQAPDQDDWKKLNRMLKYLENTIELELIIELEKGEELSIHWYPDAAFAVHPDMKSHTGAVMIAGSGAINTVSSKQKLNTRSSTEAELVAADDIAPQALWTMNFLAEQGYKSNTTIHQDNTSAILLETNGRESSSKRTRHINIRYYFITDCVDKQYFTIEYCPTDDMVGDFPSKPLQGRKFKKHRALMMGKQDHER